MKASEYNISNEKFVLVGQNRKIHDVELATKPVSYFADAFSRFKRNKGSIVASIIIILLILFAILGPMFSPYTVSYKDDKYAFVTPRNELFVKLGIDFWSGYEKKETTEQQFLYNYGIGLETGQNAVVDQEYSVTQKRHPSGELVDYYTYKVDTYSLVGVVFKDVTKEEYQALQEYQNETGIQVIYPNTVLCLRPSAVQDEDNANYWYQTVKKDGKTTIVADSENLDNSYKNIYYKVMTEEEVFAYYGSEELDAYAKALYSKKLQQQAFKDKVFADLYDMYENGDNYNSIRIEGDEPEYYYARRNETGYEIRVNYYEYYRYYHTQIAKDGIEYPSFLFGATNSGQDIFTCLSSGARFSFLLAIVIASVNLLVGAIYGAIEGYYGGITDLLMERFVDILSAVPFMVVITLLKYHMETSSQVLVIFIAFFLTGWIGMAGRTRMQFYRFKNQEYVLAARTLGASDARIMFKHIFPNALGTLITSCVLVIPSVIFSETSLSYLGIINLNQGDMTSVGTMLANSKTYLVQYPHMVLFPSLFICLLMLSFNLFGNGLRDAFNPSLRGTED